MPKYTVLTQFYLKPPLCFAQKRLLDSICGAAPQIAGRGKRCTLFGKTLSAGEMLARCKH